jgi:hypothetical protein
MPKSLQELEISVGFFRNISKPESVLPDPEIHR